MEGSYFRLMVNKKILLSVFLYGALSLIQGGHDALYPVWMINPKSSKGFEWTQTDVGYLYSLLGPVQMLSGHILFILMLNALHSTSVEWCSSSFIRIQTNVVIPRLFVHVHHSHYSYLCSYSFVSFLGMLCFSDLHSGTMVCHLFDLCCLLCCSYSSVHCYYCHYFQCFVSRFPWKSEWYWPGVCFSRSFHRKEGSRM